jgi:hypothetical protein
LHLLDVILEDDPTPSDVGDDIDESDGRLFDVKDFDHVVQVFAQVEQVLTNLNRLVYSWVLLDVL